ncbi:MAG: protein phosphatase 2C domain-containing protein [Rhodospirillaceae bacterium]|nr:protein phosphatase 2C domain-containing protein [Rhodospirillaceae bacterium]
MTDGAARSSAATAGRSVAWPASRRWQGGRPYQEDHYGVLSFDIVGKAPALLLVLADGMGGAAGGATASRAVVEAFAARFPHIDGAVDGRLRRCLDDAVAGLGDMVSADPDLEGMGSTVVAAQYDGRGIAWLSVGDSPMWLYTDGKLERLNADHSMVPVLDQLVESGELSAEEARCDRRRNMLRSAVTEEPPELIDCAERSCRLGPGDYLLIASDGIETISADEIAQILAASGGDAERAADALMSAVRAAAGPAQDNATLLLLPGPAAPAGAAVSRGGRAGTRSAVALLVASVILLCVLVYWVAATPAWLPALPWQAPTGDKETSAEKPNVKATPSVKPTPSVTKGQNRQNTKGGKGNKQSKNPTGNVRGSPTQQKTPSNKKGKTEKSTGKPSPQEHGKKKRQEPGGAAVEKENSGSTHSQDATPEK